MAVKLAGGGKGRYTLARNSEINVTPFVDVMLVLLIIFMVAAPLATTAIKINLPPANPLNAKPPHRPTFISIRAGGDVYVVSEDSTQRAPDLSRLTAILAPRLTGDGPVQERTVLIRADREVRYSQFMAVVNRLQSEGYYHVGLISEELG